jgi:adenylate kinase family enzyme
MIIGCCGAGKFVLSKQIAAVTKLPLYHLDKIYWKPGWIQPQREEWVQACEELVSKEEWIIDGNYGSTMEMRLSRADTIIYLDQPALTCLYRVIKRRYTGNRDDITTACNEKLDFQFLHYIAMFNSIKKP